MTLIILIGVVLIADGKLWKIVTAQGGHNRKVETLPSEIRDKLATKGSARNKLDSLGSKCAPYWVAPD